MTVDVEVFEELFSPGRWFQVPKVFLAFLDFSEAIYLSYLIGVSRTVQAQKLAKGWFYHTSTQIKEDIGLPRWRQDELLKSLKNKDFLKTELRGMPAKRYFKIKYKTLREAVVLALNQHLVVGTVQQQGVGTVQQQSKSIKTRMRTKGSQPPVDKLFKPPRRKPKIDRKFIDWARRLHRIIGGVFKLSPPFDLIKWSIRFSTRYKEIQSDDNRVNKALDKIEKHGHDYAIACVDHFFNQIPHIEKAEERRKKKEEGRPVIN